MPLNGRTIYTNNKAASHLINIANQLIYNSFISAFGFIILNVLLWNLFYICIQSIIYSTYIYLGK